MEHSIIKYIENRALLFESWRSNDETSFFKEKVSGFLYFLWVVAAAFSGGRCCDLFMFFLRSRVVVDQAVPPPPPTRLSHGVLPVSLTESLSHSPQYAVRRRSVKVSCYSLRAYIYCQKGLGFLALSQGYWPFFLLMALLCTIDLQESVSDGLFHLFGTNESCLIFQRLPILFLGFFEKTRCC